MQAAEQDRDSVISDARSSVRSLKSAQISLDIQRRAIDLAQRKLDYSVELLTQGKAATRDVVDSQSDLLNAQDRYDAAKADLAYVYEWTPKTTDSLGASFHAIEASPWDTQVAGRLAVSHALTPIYTLTASADGFTNPAAARFGLRLSF